MRPLTQAICALVRGFHTGEVSVPKAVSLCRLPPLASATQISGSPPRADEKAIFAPSDDHAGDWFGPSRGACRKAHQAVQIERIHADRPSLASQGIKRDARVVRGDAR